MDLAELKAAIAQLERDGLQRQADEGARLHAEKNAPSVSGMYADMKFPPYQFRPFPTMLYSPDYEPACAEFDAATRYRERRDEQGLRNQLIVEAQQRKDAATRIVQNQHEMDDLVSNGEGWASTPGEATAKRRKLDADIAEAAAVSAHDDKRMGELAQRERQVADDASDGHLVEVAEQRRGPGRPRKET